MENIEYIKFDIEDVIEALEDLYTKNTGKKIDIRFDKDNLSVIRAIKSITIKKSITAPVADIITNPPLPGIDVVYQPINDVAEVGYGYTTSASQPYHPTGLIDKSLSNKDIIEEYLGCKSMK